MCVLDFTFHSGYIPIGVVYAWADKDTALYIPFWIYSNETNPDAYDNEYTLHSILDIFQLSFFASSSIAKKDFTFHSGYIPMA